MIKVETELKLISPNVKLHYMTLYKKNKKIKNAIRLRLILEKHNLPELPVHVRLTRYSKKFYDWDNYISACKPIRDSVADFIIPGKAPGQADSSDMIYWHYYQEKSKDKKDRLKLEIF